MAKHIQEDIISDTELGSLLLFKYDDNYDIRHKYVSLKKSW